MENIDFKQYDFVQIKAINIPTNTLNIIGTEGVTRLPQVGDKATIVEIYKKDDVIDGFELECVNPKGLTEWLCTFHKNDIEMALF
jgi:hypothetical protein